jgi:hypothetical protein
LERSIGALRIFDLTDEVNLVHPYTAFIFRKSQLFLLLHRLQLIGITYLPDCIFSSRVPSLSCQILGQAGGKFEAAFGI